MESESFYFLYYLLYKNFRNWWWKKNTEKTKTKKRWRHKIWMNFLSKIYVLKFWITKIRFKLPFLSGFDGGQRQWFIMEIFDQISGVLQANVSSKLPIFTVGGLDAGKLLKINIYAANVKGKSEAVLLEGFTLKAAEKQTGTYWSKWVRANDHDPTGNVLSSNTWAKISYFWKSNINLIYYVVSSGYVIQRQRVSDSNLSTKMISMSFHYNALKFDSWHM